MKFRNSSRDIAVTDTENANLAAEHFKQVFNRDAIVDWQHINRRKDKPTVDRLVAPLIFREFDEAINKLTWHKAQGINGISPNILKVLNKDNKRVLFEFMKVWMEDEDVIYDE